MYSIALFFLLLGGEGLTRNIPFQGWYALLFLLQFIPSFLLYIIPIASFYSYATVAYHLEIKGLIVWFDYLSLLRLKWRLHRFFFSFFLLILYGWIIGWGAPWSEQFLYKKYQKYGFEQLQYIPSKTIYSLQNRFFISIGKNEQSSMSQLFFNYFLSEDADFILAAEKGKQDIEKDQLILQNFHGYLVHDRFIIRMQCKQLTCDMQMGMDIVQEEKASSKTIVQLWKDSKRSANKELLKRLLAFIFCMIIPWIGWSQGRNVARQNKSFVFLLVLGLFWLLTLYIILHTCSFCL
ncbi:hypothetical protein COB28_03420 [Candidatus Dependentiae bacterium]|nr:MAG: hypothetical protein COB28_03420 [Candidatus Dependentiae bacterium]